jgi:hypothetical protein
VKASGESWLTGWGYRKSHEIYSAAGAGTSYQVKVTVHYGSGADGGEHVYLDSNCRTDFGDIRFTDDDGVSLLDYWMESKTDGDNAVFWVEVADDLSSQNRTIYVYYNNSDVTTTSSLADTATELYDFEGGMEGWTFETDYAYTPYSIHFYAVQSNSYRGSWSAELFTQKSGFAGRYARIYKGFSGGRRFHYWVKWSGSLSDYKQGAHWVGDTRYGDFQDDGSSHSYTKFSFTFTGAQTIKIGQWSLKSFDNYPTNWYYDCFYTFKYVSPEPSHGGWGTAEEWLSGWTYRKSHTIFNATGAGTGYALSITVHYGSGTDSGSDIYLNAKCKTDFGDIRVAKTDGTVIAGENKGWRETKVDSDYAKIWFKIDEDLSSQNITIYVYYGKDTATWSDNGTDTFLFFDDFDDGDVSDWTYHETHGIFTGGLSTACFSTPYSYQLQKPSGSGAGINTYSELYKNLDFDGSTVKVDAHEYHYTAYPSSNAHFGRILIDSTQILNFDIYFSKQQWHSKSSSATTPANGTHTLRLRLFDASSTTKLFYIRWDDVRVRKYVDPEPQHGSWGTEEGEPPNTAPTIEEFQAPSTVYANKYFLLNATIVDANEASDFDNATVELSNSIVLKWDNATDTFTVQSDPNGYCTLDASGSFKTSLNSTAYKLSWKIKLSWSYPEGSIDIVASNTRVFDSSGAGGTGSQAGLFILEDDLTIHTDANVDKERANPSDTLTFTGTIYYEGTSTVPEDVSGITVKVELNGIDKGLDNSPTGGTYSVTVTAENLVASYNYTVYAVTDENSVQNQTLPVTVDALEVDDYTVDLANEKVYAHMRYASDHADIDGGTVAFAGRTAATNSTGWACFDLASGSDFSWNQTAYGTTDGTYGITTCEQNQTLLIARKTRLIQSDLEISSLSWDGTKLTVQFAGTTGTYTLKVSGPRPTYIKGTSYDLPRTTRHISCCRMTEAETLRCLIRTGETSTYKA